MRDIAHHVAVSDEGRVDALLARLTGRFASG
jgi:hypothetical protein